MEETGSRIFEGVRSIGRVSDHVPCILRYVHRKKLNLIISSAGNFFNTYQSQQLKLISVSESSEANQEIGCLAGDTYHVYTGSGKNIYAWRRGTELKHTYKGHEANVILLLPLAQNLISIDESGQLIKWNISSEEIEWTLNFNVKTFKPSALMHPATYTNKILIGSEQGSMELWNIRKQSIVYRFEGWGSPITAIVQAPALNIVGIALAKRKIILHDLLYDKIILSFNCDEPPTSLAFRTDGPPMLVVGMLSGTITLYNLENKSIELIKEFAHHGPITGIQCFHQEPLFVTSSPDNSIRVWIFDMPDGTFRLLNSREGHSKPPKRIRFQGNTGFNILSAGKDSSLRLFHIYNETYNRCLSKNQIPPAIINNRNFKRPEDLSIVPQIVDFTTESIAKPTHYDDLAACHSNQVGLSTWSIHGSKKGNKVLILPKYKNIPVPHISATCLCMTACGQFVIAGYSNGTIERFNIQSGAHRKTYGNPAHSGSVRGVAVDRLNMKLISGASTEFAVKIWKFDTAELVGNIKTESSISFLFFQRNSSMVGVALDGFEILIIDLNSVFVFRRISNIPDTILDACFSPDSRWVTVSFTDRSVRTWDLPTSRLIDAFLLWSPVSSLDYSSNSEYLATALCDQLEILLWANKTLYIHVSLMPLPDTFEPGLNKIATKSENDEDDFDDYVSPDQIDECLITLSLLPDSKWKCLLNLDTIEKRNKPKEAAKTFVAPFFLSGLVSSSPAIIEMNKPKIEIANNSNSVEGQELEKSQETNFESSSRILSLGSPKSELAALLDNYKSGEEDELCSTLGRMRPKQLDLEFRSLGPNNGGSFELLKNFLTFLKNLIGTKRFYEAREAYLALFLKIHSEIILSNTSLCEILELIYEKHKEQNDVIQEETTSILGLISFIKSNV